MRVLALPPRLKQELPQNSFEFFPNRGDAVPFPFLTRTSGLNTYVHAFVMPSGRMFLQANVSAILWDYDNNQETPLPEMPGGVVRVYPASGAVAMLPLTPANNWNPTILFCGGQDMTDEQWGDFAYPRILVWDKPASVDCQRITPEPADGSDAAYEQDDDMLEGRTMGQFIILPDGKLLVLNGALNGTAGYAKSTSLIPDPSDMPVGESLAIGPVLTPAIYDPNAPRGQRWSRKGLDASTIPRMYHSSALLLPDASVIVAGSNPNVDVNLTTIYPTTYAAEIFYPPYFRAPVRPKPQGVPKTLSYGGEPFDVTIAADQYSGSASDAAKNAIVSVIRPGFTTHAMNMGQRFLQLDHSYTVKKEGTITLHVAQMPPNANIFQPGPAFLYVTINGVPSNGTYVIVGNGQVGPQPVADASVLPQSVVAEGASGKASPESTKFEQTTLEKMKSKVPLCCIFLLFLGLTIPARIDAAVSRQVYEAHQQQQQEQQNGEAEADYPAGARTNQRHSVRHHQRRIQQEQPDYTEEDGAQEEPDRAARHRSQSFARQNAEDAESIKANYLRNKLNGQAGTGFAEDQSQEQENGEEIKQNYLRQKLQGDGDGSHHQRSHNQHHRPSHHLQSHHSNHEADEQRGVMSPHSEYPAPAPQQNAESIKQNYLRQKLRLDDDYN